jgi:hypothetical protein
MFDVVRELVRGAKQFSHSANGVKRKARHSRATTTLDIYQQFVPQSQQRAVNRLSDPGTSTN